MARGDCAVVFGSLEVHQDPVEAGVPRCFGSLLDIGDFEAGNIFLDPGTCEFVGCGRLVVGGCDGWLALRAAHCEGDEEDGDRYGFRVHDDLTG